ncbi:hypothetical protein V8E53_006112 [Lactarius tabidus]
MTSLASSCTNVVPESEPEPVSIPSIIPTSPPFLSSASLCTAVDPEPEPLSNYAFSSASPLMSPHELVSSHVPPPPSFSNSMTDLLECSPSHARLVVEVQPPELASLPLPLGGHLEQESSHSPVNIALNPSESSANSECFSLVPVPLEVSSACMTSHWQERTLRVTPSEVVSMCLPLAARLTPSLEVSNAPISPRSTSKFEVTPAVMSTTLLPANIRLALRLPSAHSNRSHVSPRPLSTIEISSSNRGPPSSLSKVLPVCPTPLLEISWNVPSRANSSLSQQPPVFMQENSPFVTLEASLSVPAPPHSTPPQQPLGVTPVDSDSSPLEVRPAPASSTTSLIPQQHPFEVMSQVPTQRMVPQRLKWRGPSLVHEDSSTHVLCHSQPSPLLQSTPARFKFALSLVTTAVLVSALADVSVIIPTHTHRFQSKNEDFRSRQNSTTILGNTFEFAQLLQLVQYKPHTVCFVFDPGGSV